ncbi:hypothetical protein RF11_04061 [Thelohanellus kitauei]|uniref:Uncharacterized protein n=1 Tax=Thelohanellus kitauei TaxID=669202 RepID=A0A0C2JIU5_THEKT|nr:hypothetical protein RF11_04061 [Thelohanellus kitauei]
MAFYEAAEIGKIYKLESEIVIQTYQRSADCFLKINDNRALLCFENAIDVFYENGSTQETIQLCFQNGYKCEEVLEDKTLSHKLYDRADELRRKHGYKHTCQLIEFRPEKYINNLRYLNVDIKKFRVYKCVNGSIVIDFISLCRKCVNVYEKLIKIKGD